jgi:intracellular sulfur oxidation DsrE/DsrF family protein
MQMLSVLCMLVGLSNAVVAAEKPFAEHKLVLQISDDDPFKQTLVLNVANNFANYYGADKVDVEVVAFGPGLRLLFEENANNARIQSLADSYGINFTACNNTIANMSRVLGEPVAINPIARTDSPGIVRISKLVDDGYLLVKP